jgi:hypothetical protein
MSMVVTACAGAPISAPLSVRLVVIPVHTAASPVARIVLLVFVALLLLLAWGGYLDIYSHDYLAESIKNTGILYGIVRAINALVSVLQSSELSVMLVSVNIGELLDPLNDLVERFSHVLVVALGALVFQKIMLGMVSHDGFNVVMTALMLVLVYSSSIRKLPFHSHIARTLLLALFLRFALATAVFFGSLIDSWFLEDAMSQQAESMVQLEGQLSNTRDVLSGDSRSPAVDSQPEQHLQRAGQEQRELEAMQQRLGLEIEQAEAEIAAIKAQLPWHQSLFSAAWPAELLRRSQALGKLQSRQRTLEAQLDAVARDIDTGKEVLECQRLRAQGQSCSMWDWFDSISPYEKYRQTLSAIAESMDIYVENIIDLIVGLLLKSVILPLLLLYGIYRGACLLWSLPVD